MKRITIILLAIILMLPLCACSQEKEDLIDPVSYYYPRKEPTHGNADSLITAEIREGHGHIGDLGFLMEQYIYGPLIQTNKNPFPVGTRLISTELSEDRVIVILTEHFGSLTGIDLTVACACIYMTASELSGCDMVEIRAENASLDGKPTIILDQSVLLLLDTFSDNTKTGGES